jgi:hypothetical protein
VYRELGLVDRATSLDADAAEAGRASGESEAEANALVNLSEDRIASRAPDAAAPFARVTELADADAWLRWRYRMRLEAARARERLAAGAIDEALAAAGRLREHASAQQASKYLAIACELEARAALARGDVAGAAAAIGEARALLANKPVPLLEWKLDALAADIAERASDTPAAQAARSRASAAVERIAAGLRDTERAAFLTACRRTLS